MKIESLFDNLFDKRVFFNIEDGEGCEFQKAMSIYIYIYILLLPTSVAGRAELVWSNSEAKSYLSPVLCLLRQLDRFLTGRRVNRIARSGMPH